MSWSHINVLLGAMLYASGVIAVNIFLEPAHRLLLVPGAVELSIITLGVFFLSSFFWGRASFVLLLFTGLWLGGLFPKHPAYVALAGIPLLVALSGGTRMGENAQLDISGRGNLFEGKIEYIEAAVLAALLAVAIGFLTPGIQIGDAQGALEAIVKALGVA